MSTLKTTNLQNASAASPAIVLAADGSATAQLSSINGGPLAGSRNRVINGDMRIDQRNAGAAFTPTGAGSYTYFVDRWALSQELGNSWTAQQNRNGVTPPAGFTNYFGVQVNSASTPTSGSYNIIQQSIEGFNVADLDWGLSTAKAVTLSFWVRSSLTGQHSGSVRNGAATFFSYPFAYTISSANTWEYKTVSIPGPTTGNFATNNSTGISLFFDLGNGSSSRGSAGSWASQNVLGATGSVNVIQTNGATFYITGVQLEPGTVATPFERRIIGQELTLCQRYYATTQVKTGAYNTAGAFLRTTVYFPVSTRVAPTLSASVTETSNAGAVSLDTGTIQTCRYLHSVTATGESYTQANVTISAEL